MCKPLLLCIIRITLTLKTFEKHVLLLNAKHDLNKKNFLENLTGNILNNQL